MSSKRETPRGNGDTRRLFRGGRATISVKVPPRSMKNCQPNSNSNSNSNFNSDSNAVSVSASARDSMIDSALLPSS